MYERYGKRLLDIILSLAATIILAIPMGLVALWIKLDSPGPVFFKQRRVGKGKTHFNILKFRTMRGDTPHDVPTHLLKDADSYITGSGAFLRKTSLDEFPQFLNVLKGDMSVVGPRPDLKRETELYEGNEGDKLLVKPGITGYSAVKVRNSAPWHERLKLDVWYVHNVTFALDVKVFFATFGAVFGQKGIYVEEGSEGEQSV